MGTCSETIYKHQILFPSIQNLAWLPQGRPQGKQKCGKIAIFGLTHWLKHRITRKLLKIDRYMLRGVWQTLNCLSIYGTYWVIIAGASPGETIGQFSVTIPEPHATLQGAVTWRNQCRDRATLQGVIIPSAILKIVFRHILFLFCF